jgi:8-oxo-(d)GTP phosphatase
VTIKAAGVVCWREQKGKLEFLLVSREKYNDWSFPKGKQDPGEILVETAVREMFEETGIKLKVGRKLPVAKYKVSTGEEKEVHYWASRVKEKAWKKSKFKPNEEIQKLEWIEFDSAKKILTYSHDKDLAIHATKLWRDGLLETKSLIILRHAKATPRSDWKNGEATRPLLPEGKVQAKKLANTLLCFGPKRLISSPWQRCVDTIEPYAKLAKKKVVLRSQITEFKSKKNPKQARQIVEDLFDSNKNALICTHRPALPEVLKAIAQHAQIDLKQSISKAEGLEPGEFLVVRVSLGEKPKVVDLELLAEGA